MPRGFGSGAESCMQHQEIACNNIFLERKKCNKLLLHYCSVPHTGQKIVGFKPVFF